VVTNTKQKECRVGGGKWGKKKRPGEESNSHRKNSVGKDHMKSKRMSETEKSLANPQLRYGQETDNCVKPRKVVYH